MKTANMFFVSKHLFDAEVVMTFRENCGAVLLLFVSAYLVLLILETALVP